MEELKQRSFAEIRKEKGIKASFVAQKLNITTATLRNKEKNKTEFSAREARELIHIYDVDFSEVRL